MDFHPTDKQTPLRDARGGGSVGGVFDTRKTNIAAALAGPRFEQRS